MKSLILVTRILTLLIVVSCGGSAWARAVVLESVPADGEVLARAPGEIIVRFDRLIDPKRTRLNFSDLRARLVSLPRQPKASAPTDRLTVVMPLLGMGSYILRYKVVATDGEPTYGSVSFTAGGY